MLPHLALASGPTAAAVGRDGSKVEKLKFSANVLIIWQQRPILVGQWKWKAFRIETFVSWVSRY